MSLNVPELDVLVGLSFETITQFLPLVQRGCHSTAAGKISSGF